MRLKDLSQDVLIENGDKITIPLLPQFKKEKEVYKTRLCFRSGAETRMSRIFSGKATVADVLSQSQGIIMARANLKHVNVIRGTPDNPVFIKLNYYNFLNNGDTKQNIRIKDGDVIFVPRKGLVKTQDTVAQIGSILNVVLAHPASFREKYTTGGGLRMDTDVNENR